MVVVLYTSVDIQRGAPVKGCEREMVPRDGGALYADRCPGEVLIKGCEQGMEPQDGRGRGKMNSLWEEGREGR